MKIPDSRTAFVVAGCLAAMLMATDLPAAVVAAYRFDTNDVAGLNASEYDGALLSSAGAVTPNAGYGLFAAQNSSNDAGLASYGANQPVLRLSRAGDNSTSLIGALANGSYFSLTLTPSASLSLTSLTFNAARGGASADRGLAVFSTATGFNLANAGSYTQGDALLYVQHLPAGRDFVTPDAFFSVDLSGAAFQNLATPATFYFYTFTPGSGSSIEIDNITFNGIPEPSGLLWTGVGLLALRRRRTQHDSAWAIRPLGTPSQGPARVGNSSGKRRAILSAAS